MPSVRDGSGAVLGTPLETGHSAAHAGKWTVPMSPTSGKEELPHCAKGSRYVRPCSVLRGRSWDVSDLGDPAKSVLDPNLSHRWAKRVALIKAPYAQRIVRIVIRRQPKHRGTAVTAEGMASP